MSIPLNVLDDELFRNNMKRIPICICIEKSAAVYSRINKMEKSLNKLKEKIMASPDTRSSVELCIIVFSDKAVKYRDFSLFDENESSRFENLSSFFKNAKDIETPNLEEAIKQGVLLLKKRKKSYAITVKDNYQPALIIIGSGKASTPMDKISEELRRYERRSIAVMPICIAADTDEWRTNYKCLTNEGKVFDGVDGLDLIFESVGKSIDYMSASSANAYEGLKNSTKDWKDLK